MKLFGEEIFADTVEAVERSSGIRRSPNPEAEKRRKHTNRGYRNKGNENNKATTENIGSSKECQGLLAIVIRREV